MPPSKNDPPSGSSTPKIAIKGFSFASKSKVSTTTQASSSSTAKPKSNLTKPAFGGPPSKLGKRPRSSFQHHDDSDDSEEDQKGGKHEVVTAFGEDGAISREEEERLRRKEESVLVIPRQENRDWKAEMRVKRIATAGKNLLPPEVQAAQEAARRQREGGEVKMEGVDVVNSKDGEIQWGLSVRKREEVVKDGSADIKVEAEVEVKQEEVEPEKPKTADEEALQALLGAKEEKKGPDLVIPSVISNATNQIQESEADAYRRAIAAAPDVSTLEDYERVPVEEFGAALLRGMGWKGEKRGQVREVKRRQNLMGLGAKQLNDAEELGAWVQKSDVKRLNERRGGGSSGGGDRRPKASEYKREKEKRDERREERNGGGYRKERDRERDSYRERDRQRDYRR